MVVDRKDVARCTVCDTTFPLDRFEADEETEDAQASIVEA